jgi:hypothetical protein
MPGISTVTVNMRIWRDGLLVHWEVNKLIRVTIDLKEYLRLSEEQAQSLLKRLDEQDKAEVTS